MESFRGLVHGLIGMAVLMDFGCRSASLKTAHRRHTASTQNLAERDHSDSKQDHVEPTEIQTVSAERDQTSDDVQNQSSALPSSTVLDPNELSVSALVAAVLQRNPNLQAAHAAWAATVEKYPQAIALDDPMLQTMFAPASFASNQSQSSYYIGAAQKVPWHGKRSVRGQIAQWEAQAAAYDTHEVELRLAAAARMAYFDYYLVQRELELNSQNVEVMHDFRSAAKTKYESGQVSQQDLTTADLELAKLEQQRLELRQQERIAIARINTLLHQRPDVPLAPAVRQLATPNDLPEIEALFSTAVERRPELNALAARIQAEQNAVDLANKDYYPDFEFMGRYDTFWTDSTQRPQVGMNMNVPLNRDRRSAAVREAQFRVNKLCAELAIQQDAVREEVQISYAKVDASLRTARLFEQRTLPAAAANLSEARSAYVSGSIDFLRLLEARRQSTDQQIGYQRSLADVYRNRSDLDRAVGTTPGANAP